MRKPEAGPFGDTRFDPRARTIADARLVNKPGGGCVESVFTSATHRFFFAAGVLMPNRDCASLMLEVLYRSLVLLSGPPALEGTQIPSSAGLRITFPRVQPIFSALEFPYHRDLEAWLRRAFRV